MTQKLWGGRFSRGTDPLVARYTSSLAFDARLAPYELLGSVAHAKMLGRCGILSVADSRRLVRGLERLRRQLAQGRLRLNPAAEDVHTAVQQALERLIGPVARRLHAARSRNDQVSLDLRLYCRDAVGNLCRAIRVLQRALVDLAAAYRDVVIPGYTHLQRAQPVLLAHQLLAYVEMLERDLERLADARKRINVLPLGVGALAGTSLPIDRRYVARLLGMARLADNSMDAVSDRDFALELLAVLATVGVHLSRMAEDFILWASEEFGLLALDDSVATGSSLMPQKKNPDVLELLRGQAGLVIGQLTALLTVLKGLPLTYNRDLQWDKLCVFGALDGTQEGLEVLAHLLRHVRIRRDAARRLLQTQTLCATDLAEYLVARGVAFREAHEAVGRLIRLAEDRGERLSDLPLAVWRRAAPQFDDAARRLLDPRRSVARKRSAGSTQPAQVRRAIARWRRRLRAP